MTDEIKTEDLPLSLEQAVREVKTNSGCIVHLVEGKVLDAWRPVRVEEHFKVTNRVSNQEFWLVAGKEGWEIWADGDAYCNDDVSARMDKEHVLFGVLRDSAFSENSIREIDGGFYTKLDLTKGQLLNPGESTPTPTIDELAELTDKLARACIDDLIHGDRGISVAMMAEDHLERNRIRNIGGLPGLAVAGFELGTIENIGGSKGQVQNPAEQMPMFPAGGGFSEVQAMEAEKLRSPLVQFLAEELAKHDHVSIDIKDAEFIGQRIYSVLYNNTDVREERILRFATDLTAQILEYFHRKWVKPIFLKTPEDKPTELPPSNTESPEDFDLQASSTLAMPDTEIALRTPLEELERRMEGATVEKAGPLAVEDVSLPTLVKE